MSKKIEIQPESDRELVICRLIDASPEKVFRAWTEPELLKQWFAPKPWTTSHAEIDLKVGGASFIVMKSPTGEEFPNPGVYLEIVPNKKLVFTNAYTKAWEPSERPFITIILTFEELEGKTKYTARALHWTLSDKNEHNKMRFHEGWGLCADQLEAVASKL
ncbi:MAG: SRPBCC family protein [Bdellovibrionota bacterium]